MSLQFSESSKSEQSNPLLVGEVINIQQQNQENLQCHVSQLHAAMD